MLSSDRLEPTDGYWPVVLMLSRMLNRRLPAVKVLLLDWTWVVKYASVPLPAGPHRGVLPRSGGIHHYPTPVAEIAFFKYDDFNLWVTDEHGNEVAVVPTGRRGSGDGRVRALHALPAALVRAHRRRGAKPSGVLPKNHRVAEEAFADQYDKLAGGAVPAGDPLSRASLPT